MLRLLSQILLFGAMLFGFSLVNGMGKNLPMTQMRSVIKEMDSANDQEISPKFNQNVKNLMAKLFSFTYALKNTYVPNNATLSRFNATQDALPEIISDDQIPVPDEFKKFFSDYGVPPLKGQELDGFNCVIHCLEEQSSKNKEVVSRAAINQLKGMRDFPLSNAKNKKDGEDDDSENEGDNGELSDDDLDVVKNVSVKCSQLEEDVKCVSKCQKKSPKSTFASYILKYTKQFTDQLCHGDTKKEVNIDELMSQCSLQFAPLTFSKFIWQDGLNYVDEFLASKDIKKQCSLTKKALIESFSLVLQNLCTNGKLVDGVIHVAAGYVLALNTKGAMIEKCPVIYATSSKN